LEEEEGHGGWEIGLAAAAVASTGAVAVGFLILLIFILPEAVSCCDMEAAMAMAICSSSVIAAKLTTSSAVVVVVLLFSL
jgi:hypothetical protein